MSRLLAICFIQLLLSLAALAFVAGAAAARARRASGEGPWDLLACDAAIRATAAITASALALGALGWLTAPAWLAAALISGALLHWLPVRRDEPGTPRTEEPDPSVAFLVVLGGFLLGRAVFGLRNPPADWDSLQYHLPMVAHWVQSHALGVASREPQALGTYYPGGGELLQLWAALSTGRETLMTWPGIAALGLLALALRRLAINLGARAGVAEALALALVTAPGVGALTLGTRIDNILAAEFAVALLFAVRHLRDGRRGDLAVSLLAFGLAAGSKANGPLLALLALALVLIEAARRRDGRLGLAPGMLLLPLALGGFWIARNLLLTGNPLYPSEVRLGAIRLPGIESFEVLSRTTQLAVWREGYAGHLTPGNLERFFGPPQFLAALGLAVAAWTGVSRRAPSNDAGLGLGIRPLALLAIGGAALFLVSPFSGAYWPATGGRPPGLNWDNLRYLMPAVVAAVPIAALGLSRFGTVAVVLLAAAIAYDVRRWIGHVVPGIVAVAIAALALRLIVSWLGRRRVPEGGAARRPSWLIAPGVAAAAIGIALAVVAVEGKREKLTERIWDGYLPRIHNLDAASLRRVRAEAKGRPIAVVGMDAWWGYYGRDFSGRPLYVPVGRDARGPLRWSFERDPRERADSTRWRRNLASSGACFVVAGAFQGDCDRVPVERRWMAADPERFARTEGACCDSLPAPAGARPPRHCDEAWRVRDAGERDAGP